MPATTPSQIFFFDISPQNFFCVVCSRVYVSLSVEKVWRRRVFVYLCGGPKLTLGFFFDYSLFVEAESFEPRASQFQLV